MDAIPDIIRWAKKCQYLSSVDVLKSAYLDGGKIDDRHPVLLNMERRTLEYLYNQNHTDIRLPLIGNYVLSLCGKYLNKAKSQAMAAATNDTAYFNGLPTNELPSEIDILSWQLRSNILPDGTVIADFQSFIGTPKYLFVAEPRTKPIKTKYFFSDHNKGNIGVNTAWANGVVVGQFRVYVTNYKTETGFALMQLQP